MAREQRHPPNAANLLTSMRDVGYSLETALADLIDNSISAGATVVEIVCDVSADSPFLIVVDNGKGMIELELISAMRHGAGHPCKERLTHDLGRFGLGLKTASFSQCRTLTVTSVKQGKMSGAEWDLDHIDSTNDWMLQILEEDEIKMLPGLERLDGASGTAVIWRKLDRLLEGEGGDRAQEIINEKLDVAYRHLALVFHRFLSGEIKGCPRLSIVLNGRSIEPFDPFCRNNAATQFLPKEIVAVGNEEVYLQPFILPHHSHLGAAEYEHYRTRSDFLSNQGAYVYRNGRLLAWGDWFRLIPKSEATKLARVQIDFSNRLDEDWTIDIKKSRARPPHAVRERLRQIIDKISERSVKVHRGRGQKLFQQNQAPLWERYVDRGGIRFAIDGQHPLVASLRAKLSSEDGELLRILLDAIAASLPVEMIYSDYSTHPHEIGQVELDDRQAVECLNSIKKILGGDGMANPNAFRQVVRSTRLFDGQTELVDKFIREAFA